MRIFKSFWLVISNDKPKKVMFMSVLLLMVFLVGTLCSCSVNKKTQKVVLFKQSSSDTAYVNLFNKQVKYN
jgi:hypothetical protein